MEEAAGRLREVADDAFLAVNFGLALVVGLSLTKAPSEAVKREDLASAWRKYWRPGREQLKTDWPFEAWGDWVLVELAERGWLQRGIGNEVLLRPTLAGLEYLRSHGIKRLQGTQLESEILCRFLSAESPAWVPPNGP